MQGFLVVGDCQRFLAGVHVGFAEAVVGVRGIWIGFDVELEDADGLLQLPSLDELVAEIVEFNFFEVVRGRILCSSSRGIA